MNERISEITDLTNLDSIEDMTKCPEYEEARRNISAIPSQEVISLIEEYSNVLEQTGREMQGSSKFAYSLLRYFGLGKYASAIHEKKVNATIGRMRMNIEALEKLVKNKHVQRNRTFQERMKITSLLDDARLVAETNAHQYASLQTKKEELLGVYRRLTDQHTDLESEETSKDSDTLSIKEVETQLHQIDLQIEETNRTGQDAVNIYKQNSIEQDLLTHEYKKLQSEISVLGTIKGISQHNFRVYRTIQDKLRDPNTQQTELGLVKEIYSMNEQLGKFVDNIKQGMGTTDIYPSLQQQLPNQVEVEKQEDAPKAGNSPSWIHELDEIRHSRKQTFLKQ